MYEVNWDRGRDLMHGMCKLATDILLRNGYIQPAQSKVLQLCHMSFFKPRMQGWLALQVAVSVELLDGLKTSTVVLFYPLHIQVNTLPMLTALTFQEHAMMHKHLHSDCWLKEREDLGRENQSKGLSKPKGNIFNEKKY